MLLIGIPIINMALIYTGGTLVFIAASLLTAQLWSMRPAADGKEAAADHTGRPFYLSGLSFFLFRRAFLPNERARLGGNWFSLAAVNLGGVFLWASIFSEPLGPTLHAIAYMLWAAAIVPVAVELWRIARQGLARLDAISESATEAAD